MSCDKGETTEHLPKQKMEQILLDINLAEAYSTMVNDSLHTKDTKNGDSLAAYYKVIFDHHKVSQATFNTSLAWYKNHPDDMDSVFNNILLQVTKWNGQVM